MLSRITDRKRRKAELATYAILCILPAILAARLISSGDAVPTDNTAFWLAAKVSIYWCLGHMLLLGMFAFIRAIKGDPAETLMTKLNDRVQELEEQSKSRDTEQIGAR